LDIKLGEAAKELRNSLGIKQREAAIALGISDVHLCNIEKNRATPSPQLLEKYREVWGIDLYVFAWCMYGDVSKLPVNMRKAALTLLEGWKKQIKEATLNLQTE
tara:strand:+ start:881 stop:1192 length:312 start_codon:yes stop_codon:yes gene_type:complete